MRKHLFAIITVGLSLLSLTACQSSGTERGDQRPMFCADSAYHYIATQVAFGPRVPDTQAHTDCVIWLIKQLQRFGAKVTLQQGKVPNYLGQDQQIFNIIGTFGENLPGEHILLCAHYDTRPWCDEQEVYSERFQGVPGANDGASGVGVLLEIARQLGTMMQDSTLQTPVDIVLLDCEDMGTPNFYTGPQRDNTWCLGSQLWTHEYVYGTDMPLDLKYKFGILLDMVGAPDATFPKEYFSQQYAPAQVENIWHVAQKLGYSRYFRSESSYPITDDHYYINTLAGIPCVDIIHYDTRNGSGFPSWWHTTGDDMQNIDTRTLQAVGEVVLTIITK